LDYSKLSIEEIKDIISNADLEERNRLIGLLENDNRKGVKRLSERLRKEIIGHNKEIARIKKLKEYEYKYISKGAKYIAGVDEVGRGPLAGAVYACAVIMPIEAIIEGIDDSKKLSPEKRERLSLEIKENAISYGIGYVDEKQIDRVNILNATYMAMKKAIDNLYVRPTVVLVDAIRIPNVNIFQVPIIKGDSISFSIAAASIVAKVERDNYMNRLHNEFPVYNFSKNKGYGTQEHIDAIKKYGPCPYHRKSFIKNIV
jgi:ribonuclease HII